MKKNRAFVSVAGLQNDLYHRTIRDRLADLIFGTNPPSDTDSYSITIDWSLSLSCRIADGNYDWVEEHINELQDYVPDNVLLVQPAAQSAGPDLGVYRAMPHSRVETRLELVHYGRAMTTREIEANLNRRGLRPATLAELLALGEQYPDLQRRFPVVALGSSWLYPPGRRPFPYLFESAGKRNVYLCWLGPDHRWYDDRFLAVRKS